MKSLLINIVLWLGNLWRRILAVIFFIIRPAAAYRISALGGRILYKLLPPIRIISESQCQAALKNIVPDDEIPNIAQKSFIHRIWNLSDLMLAEWTVNGKNYHKYGGKIPEPHLSNLQHLTSDNQPVILLTCYYGSFDLFPVFLGYNGIKAGIVYLPHTNTGFDEYRTKIRSKSGCEMIPISQATRRLPDILEAGGCVAILADHHYERRGIPVTFMNIPTMATRSVGILADKYQAQVVVSGLRRTNEKFQFETEIADIIYPPDWKDETDPITYITRRYLRGMEKIIFKDPTQYLWGQTRWGKDLVSPAFNPGEKS